MNPSQGERMEDGKIEMMYCGKDHQDAVGDWWRCGKAEGACPSCLLAHIAKQDAALEAAQAELAALRGQAEELATLREIVRLLDEARQRYARVPRAGAATSMGDEIDKLLNQLFEMGAHPADMRPKPPTPGVVPVPMDELATLRDGFGLLRTAWNLSLCGERIGARAGALIERYDALRAGEAGK